MTGLVLEGGGMRGAFTAGVLDVFLQNNIHFNSVYGVSAGASNGASYIAGQEGRNRKIFVDGVKNHKYFSIRHVFTQKNFLDVRLLFDNYPNKTIPFDYNTFENSSSKFFTVLTDCDTGKPEYIERNTVNRSDFMLKILAGSNSLPLLSPMVNINGRRFLDGGLSDSIPLKRAESDGCKRTVIILTRPRGYKKEHSSLSPLIRIIYKGYPKMTERFGNRHNDYNSIIDYCNSAENTGTALLIRPETTMNVSRTEKDFNKLQALYNHGFALAETELPHIRDFLTIPK